MGGPVHESERRPCWTVGGIVKSPGGSVEAAGIATVAADSKRVHRTREGRKTAGTRRHIRRCSPGFTSFNHEADIRVERAEDDLDRLGRRDTDDWGLGSPVDWGRRREDCLTFVVGGSERWEMR